MTVSEDTLMSSLDAGSSVEVSRSEVVSRWHSNCNLNGLMTYSDSAWQEFNVLGG